MTPNDTRKNRKQKKGYVRDKEGIVKGKGSQPSRNGELYMKRKKICKLKNL